jgi:DNA-dependent RNA polymerase auxiliary subunit epsilon
MEKEFALEFINNLLGKHKEFALEFIENLLGFHL